MSKLDRRVFVIIGLLALCVVLLAAVQVHLGPGKSDANTIISPWSRAQAPPQGISKSSIKIDMPQPHNVRINNEGCRTASAAAALR